MNGDGCLAKDSNMNVVSGYDSTSYLCAKCRRMFLPAEFLNHIVGCLGIEKFRELARRRRYQIRAPAQRGEARPSVTPPRVLNLFNDPLELRLAPPARPPLPPQPMNLDLTLAIGQNKPGGSQQHHGNNNRAGPSDGNDGKNFRM